MATKQYVRSLNELAVCLDVTRESIRKWRQKPGAPKPGPDGRHNVTDWLAFIKEQCEQGGIRTPETWKDADYYELKNREVWLKCEKLQVALEKERGDLVPVSDVQTEIVRCGTHIRNTLRQKFENDLPPRLVGMEAGEIQKVMRDSLDEVLKELSNVKYVAR